MAGVSLAACVGVTPATGWAGPARGKNAQAEADAAAAMEEARTLYDKGKAAYETFQYQTAIDLWTEAYSKIPEDQPGIRNRMVYNIAAAQEKQYDVDKNVAHLRQAVLQLESWVKNFKAMYKKTPETAEEVAKAEARIDELEAKIAAIESGAAPEPPGEASDDPATAPAPQTSIGFESNFEVPPEVMENRKKQAAENESEGLIAAGWTVGGIGTLFALAGAGALAGASDTAGGRYGGGGALGLGLAMMAAGGVLLGVGYKKKKAIAGGDYSVAPVVGPRTAGAVFQMRF